MTPEQVATLSDAELAIAVAREVHGWPLLDESEVANAYPHLCWIDDQELYLFQIEGDSPFSVNAPCDYMAVAAALHEEGFVFSLRLLLSGQWRVEVCLGDSQVVERTNASPGRAIFEAALLVVTCEEGEKHER